MIKSSILKNLYRIIRNPDKDTINKLIFLIHEFIVFIIFGSPKEIYEFQISENLLKKLISWEIETKDYEFTDDFKIKNLIYNYEETTKNNKKKLYKKKLLKIKPQMPLKLQRLLHNEVRKNIKLKVKSPFFIVNTRSWITYPVKDFEYGPTKMHRDGFWPGHLKVMIYLTPLNNECGKLEIKNYGVITNRDIGHAILFLNSDLLHKAIPGNSKERISIEITIMRSLLNNNQTHIGHSDARHFSNIFFPYFKKFKSLINN